MTKTAKTGKSSVMYLIAKTLAVLMLLCMCAFLLALWASALNTVPEFVSYFLVFMLSWTVCAGIGVLIYELFFTKTPFSFKNYLAGLAGAEFGGFLWGLVQTVVYLDPVKSNSLIDDIVRGNVAVVLCTVLILLLPKSQGQLEIEGLMRLLGSSKFKDPPYWQGVRSRAGLSLIFLLMGFTAVTITSIVARLLGIGM